MPRPFQRLIALASWLVGTLIMMPTARARTINWGSNVGSALYDSNGILLGNSFVFEIGSFGSFIPDATNLNLWGANWKIFDRAQAPAINGWNSTFGFVTSSANLGVSGTSSESPPLPAFTFAQGEAGYLWAFNTKTLASGTEWALITNNSSDSNPANNWVIPAPSDQTSLPLDWRLSNANAVIFGGLNNVEGAGAFAVTPGSFNLQTHSAVPEPGSAWLVIITGLSFFIGRRRRR
ncbi:MAG: PEP-CTERM sorting domain-containing protein [Verrucomicrobia bacterium]|nr:PEP-CTERM sorting domain-containing protein [Verrucomicrobiota bacterium]